MIELRDLEAYCNKLLEIECFQDYCPNGLQVDAGRVEIEKVVTGVTACQALIDAAVEAKADLLLVHHGYFWKGESEPLKGIKGCRIRTLMQAGVNLLAYHLPLDAHPQFGNNAQLAERLGFPDATPMKDGLIWQASLQQPLAANELAARIAQALDRQPLHIPAGDRPLQRVGWCSGAAQDAIEQAAELKLDAFITGELSERTMHLARELGIHFYAAGHHATERYGIQALGEHLAECHALEHQFIDIPNPA
ncbi:MAG: Nif3-like dinuclear metal center hexameric protein [Candidatus Polarisedimenticolaceae bacterium]|nr:Nif3-like dinuclear metal center hexameric protein [Candidatus Polarisedimenticolaceae bacterium]